MAGFSFKQTMHNVSAGHTYRVSVWLRESVSVPVTVAVRREGPPYDDLASSVVTPGGTWQKATFDWYASRSDDVCLMIREEQPVTLWARAASVMEITPAAAPGGNLLPDGSFETGLAAGWSVWNTDGGSVDHLPVLDRTTAFAGKSSLRIDIPTSPGAALEINSPPIPITQPGTYTATIALKVANGPVGLSVSLENSQASQGFSIDSHWRRVSISGTLQPGQTRLVIRSFPFTLQKVTSVWIDAAELSFGPGPTPAYVPHRPVELNLTCVQPAHAFLGLSHAILHVEAAGSAPPGCKVSVVITDLYGDRRVLPAIAPSAAAVTVPLDRSHPYGMFKATAMLRDASGQDLSAPVECVFAHLRKPRDIDPNDSFFGVHLPLLPAFYPIARAIGARWVRLHDASGITVWTVVQPKPGPFRFFDAQVDAARALGLQILGMLDGAPGWTTVHPQGGGLAYFYNNPDAPDALMHWHQYVDAMVRHYKGRIDNWEVWNEPWGVSNHFFPGTPEQYGALLRIAYATAKEANPGSTILGIDTYRPIPDAYPDWTKLALQASGSAYYDAFSYHDYAPDTVGGPDENVELKDGKSFRALQARYGNGPVKPQWTTEGGVDAGVLSTYGSYNSGGTLLADQAKLVRALVSWMAAGSRRFFLYTLYIDSSPYGRTDIVALEYDRGIRPQLAGFATLASLVDGAGTPVIDNSVPGVQVFRFEAIGGQQVNVLWSIDGQVHTLPRPKAAKTLDIQGNPVFSSGTLSIGPIPVYVVRGMAQ